MGVAEPDAEPESTLTRATTLLGEPEAHFRANPRRLRLKFLLATGLLLYGGVANILWFGIGPAKVDHLVLHFLFVPPVIGVGLLWHMWRHRGLRVLLYPAGLLRLQHGEAESFPWDDIAAIRFKLDLQGQPRITRNDNGEVTSVILATSAPTFQVWNVWIELIRNDEVTAKFTAALADFPDLVERIQRGTFPHLMVKAKAEIAAGQTTFGDRFTVTRDEVRSLKVGLRWEDIKTASMTGRILSIKRKGSWMLGTIARDSTTIQNLHVLFGLLAEHGVVETPADEPDAE